VKLLNWPPDDTLGSRLDGEKVLEWGRQIAGQVDALGPEMQSHTDDALGALTGAFRARLARGEPLDDLMPQAFAAVREVAARTLGWRPLDVQIIGGAVLHRGKIAEMRAGEGKTLTAALTGYLNALPGRGVHVMTVSDYLAARDAGRMAALYRFLGLSTGLVTAVLPGAPDSRRLAYEADVTYGDWKQFAFDYLRDNLAWGSEQMVQRGHFFAIADDADLILIDAIESQQMITAETRTLAMAHVRDYLGQYQRLAGMTGTAVTDALAYQKIYHLDVVPVPAGKPVIRVDHPDAVHRTTQAKLAALADEAAARHATGQPVLIGATSSEEAQTVSGLLARRGIGHEVLTGADDERDAQAIAEAGRRSAVTIIAGMAGRGVDICLGGATGAGHAEIAGLGGLCVLGTQRPACRRQELELRDRAGCQGDPGEATYFLSIDDDRIMRLFSRRVASLITRANRSPGLSELIDNAQAWAAVSEAEQLGQVVSYQSVLADQQLVVYARRRAAFTGEGLRDRIRSMIDEVIRAHVATPAGEHAEPAQLWRELRDLYPVAVTPEALAGQCGCAVAALTPQFIATQVAADAQRAYDRREAELGEPVTREFERLLTISVIDRAWCEHLQAMSDLLDGLAARSADGTVPLPDYQREAALLFAGMDGAVNREIIYGLFNLEVTVEES